jgi:polyisoprenoid-binding protein YceI
MNNQSHMTLNSRLFGLCAGALALAVTTTSLFAQAVTYTAQPGSKVKIEGTSSLHPWDVNGSVIGGTMEVDPKFPEAGTVKPTATTRIPVRTLKSYQKKMDEVMQEYMEMAKFPNIEYKLTELKSKGAPKGNVHEFDATGDLTIHGTTKSMTMPVTIEKLEGNKLKVVGKTPLKTTDYGVKPVDVNLGIGHITTGADVTLSFEWMLGKKE